MGTRSGQEKEDKRPWMKEVTEGQERALNREIYRQEAWALFLPPKVARKNFFHLNQMNGLFPDNLGEKVQ